MKARYKIKHHFFKFHVWDNDLQESLVSSRNAGNIQNMVRMLNDRAMVYDRLESLQLSHIELQNTLQDIKEMIG